MMIRYIYILLYCLTLMFSLSSCNVPVAGEAVPILYTSYVYSYHFPAEMKLETNCFGYSEYPYDSTINSPYGFDVLFIDNRAQIVGQSQKGREREIFDSLSIKHGDTNFNQYVTSSSARPNRPHAYLGIDFVSITVTSDTDFDEQHPAGTSLNDIVQYMAYTPYPFIQSGYKYSNPKGDNRWDLLKQELTLIDKPLSECTPEDFILTLGVLDNWIYGKFPACYLLINGTPTSSQKHTITVTILDDAGKTWQSSINMDWSKYTNYLTN